MSQAMRALLTRLRFTAEKVSRFLGESRAALAILARHPLIQELDPERCATTVRALVDINPIYANLVVRDRGGSAVCAAQGTRGRFTQLLPTAAAFEQAIRENRFLVSEPAFGLITGRWVVVLRHLLHDGAGRAIGLINAPLDLAKFSLLVLDPAAPSHPPTHIVDGNGTVLASSEAGWIGRNLRGEKIIEIALERGAGSARAVGPDGIERFCGIASVADTDWRAISGVPTSEAHAVFMTHAQLGGAGVILIMLMAVGVWYWMGRAISRPMEHIAAVAKRIAAGDHEVRARILAVADVVEAMSSHRPYRAGLGIAAALAEIEGKRGSWFEPQAVDAWLRLFRQKGYSIPD